MNLAESGKEGKKSETALKLTVGAACRLEGASEELLGALRRRLTIANPKYEAAKRYGRWIGKNLQAELQFYQDEENGIVFPRGFANGAVLLCRRHAGHDPEIVDQRRLLPEISLEFHGELRDYQQEAVKAVLAHTLGVLEAGTGSGKTVMALQVLSRRRQPTLVLVHSKELLHQWHERVSEFLGIRAGMVGDGHFDLQPVTIAIVNSARKRLDQLVGRFGHLIVDECHRVPASLFTEVVSSFAGYYLLGLSATAFRREDGMTELIYLYMGDRLHLVGLDKLAASGAVVRPRLIQRETAFFYNYQGEYPPMIKKLAADESRNQLICQDIATLIRKGHEGTILVVSDRVAHCETLATKLRDLGVESALLTGQVSAQQREEVVRAVREGAIPVLISTVQLIGEGFDCPGLATLVLATPIKFAGRLLQVVGRIVRPAANKKAQVVDYVDVMVPLLSKSAKARQRVFAGW